MHVRVCMHMCLSGGGGMSDATLRSLSAVHTRAVPGRPAAAADRAGHASSCTLAPARPPGPCPVPAGLH